MSSETEAAAEAAEAETVVSKLENIMMVLDRFVESKDDRLELTEYSLNKEEREQVHQWAEKLGIGSYSVGNMARRTVVLTRITKGRIEMYQPHLIEQFIKMTKIPIPNTLPHLLDYYLNLLNPYYRAKSTWMRYTESVSRFKSFNAFMTHVNGLRDQVIGFIREKTADKPKGAKLETGKLIPSKGSVYNHDNAEMEMMSVDIASANFTVLKRYGWYDFEKATSWEEFMARFTDDKFLINNKYLREMIFGRMRLTKTVLRYCNMFLSEIKTFLSTEFDVEDDDYIMIRGDELVFEFAHLDDLMTSRLKQEFGDSIHVEAFTLQRLDPVDFYVKEHTNERIEFKSIPRSFVCQAIKRYHKKEINEKDRTFIHAGMAAVFTASVFD